MNEFTYDYLVQKFIIPVLRGNNNEYTKFILFARARTGSTFLLHSLNSNKEIVYHFEVFNPKTIYFNSVTTKDKEIISFFKNNPSKIMDVIFSYYSENIKAVGFKLLYKHVTSWNYIRENKIKIIHLKRKNYLRQYVSFKLAEKNNKYTLSKGEKPYDKLNIYVDPNTLIRLFSEMEEEGKKFEEMMKFNDVLNITYRDLCDDFQKTTKLVQEFLNVKTCDLHCDLLKQNTRKLAETINFDEVKNKLKNTKWEIFLDE